MKRIPNNHMRNKLSTGWNYSDLSKLAKMNGGPEMLISKIKEGSFQKGLDSGRKESCLWIIGSALITACVLAYEEGPKIARAVKHKLGKKAIVEEAVSAEEILLKEIRGIESAEDSDTIQFEKEGNNRMIKYQVLLKYSDGTEELDDVIFDNEEDAEEYGCYLVGCCRTGAETLNLSNPGDYPLEDYEDPIFEVVKTEE